MARIRSIKPSFFTSLTIADIDDPWTRLLFIGLWTHVDDEGRCIEDRRLIRAAVFPLDDHPLDDIGRMIAALAERDLIVRYGHDDRRYIAVAAWNEHQKIDRSKESTFPGPDDLGSVVLPADAPFDDGATKHRRAIDEPSLLEGKGREGKGTVATPPKRRQREQQTLNGTPAPDTAKGRRDALWEALEPELGPAVTTTERSNRGRTITELLGAEAAPADVSPRCAEYRRRMPGIPLTDASLRKHWSSLTPKNGSTPREGFDDEGNWFDPDTGAWIQAQTYQQNTTR